MKTAKANSTPFREPNLLVGSYTKGLVSKLIYAGCRHVHSTENGQRDRSTEQTAEALSGLIVPSYEWENLAGAETLEVHSSAERHGQVKDLLARWTPPIRRSTGEICNSVLEELLSNALYHSARSVSGTDKYSRDAVVKLNPHESATVKFSAKPEGIYLSVKDTGGTLNFESFAESLHRCYSENGNQIQGKVGGAGLGIYMVFEYATHIKIISTPGLSTEFSVWLDSPRKQNSKLFSFNFFEGVKP